mgnify:CR=1 FL=1|jgi:CheY-like chemotaxis protein
MAHILSIEDHQKTRELLVTMLEAMGHTAESAIDGESGVEAAKSGNFDLILMDIMMPGIDGREATRQLRTAGIKLPIIAVTANAMTGEREKCIDAGMTDYLAKPVTFDCLKEMVQKYL